MDSRGEWTLCVHPEGAPYFMHSEKKYFTDAQLNDATQRAAINSYVTLFESLLAVKKIEMTEDLEVVLELLPGEGSTGGSCGYYIADNSRRTLFWMHEYEAISIADECEGVLTSSHLSLALEAKYWEHYSLFPNHRKVNPDILAELNDMMMFHGIDTLTSGLSLSPYSNMELREMREIVQSIQGSSNPDRSPSYPTHVYVGAGPSYGYSAQIVGRLMSIFVASRFINYHGEFGARISRHQSVYESRDSIGSLLSTLKFSILSYPLFNGPKYHLASLERMWVDRVINYQDWARHLALVLEEWTKTIFMSLITLAIIMVTLSIASGKEPSRSPSLSQEALLFSALFDVTSVITALVLVRQHRTLPRDDASAAQRYLWSKPGGLPALAVAYSIPYALSLWAIVGFTVALVCVAFDVNLALSISSVQARVAAAVLCGCLVSCLAWVLLMDCDEFMTKFGEFNEKICDAVYTLKLRITNFRMNREPGHAEALPRDRIQIV